MSQTVETRCTQCRTVNKNSLKAHQVRHSLQSAHGTENVYCESCGETTLQNRCGRSVPSV